VDELKMNVKYQRATYERTFEKGDVVFGISKLIVDHEPKK